MSGGAEGAAGDNGDPGPAARRRRILALALPIIGGMVSQNVLNLVDAAMVGALGNEALGAVGLGSFANFFVSAFITALSAGVQAMAARRVGEGRDGETAVPLNGGLVLAILIGVPWSVLLISQSGALFGLLSDDPEVIRQGVPYLSARLVAITAMGMNFSFRGYWNATDRSRLYMGTLILMHTINITLNWVLIFGKLGAPAMGAAGAGVASAISTYVGTAAYIVLGLRHARTSGFLRGLPDRGTLLTMLRLSVPMGIQQMLFAAGLTLFLKIVGMVGTAELAATHVLTQLVLVGLLPGMGFGLAAASLVGQALGRKDPADARRWGREVMRLAAVVVGIAALPAAVFPEVFLGIFLRDAATVELAVWPLRLVALLVSVDVVGMVLMNAMIGAGDTIRTMVVSVVLQWVVFLPGVWLVGPVLGMGLTVIWLVNVGYRAVQTGAYVVMWRRGRWATIQV